MTVNERVAEALDRAVVNGYDLREDDPEAVAVDLAMRCVDLESVELEELVPAVKAWQTTHSSLGLA